MLSKLAVRNVRRQIGNYLIYFITVALTVAMMFALNNVIYSSDMVEKAEEMENLSTGLLILTILVAIVVSFVLGYATSFMLRLRKREFGTYLTLGMSRRNLLTIFITETLLLCVAALGAGILLGLFFYQGMMAVTTTLMEVELTLASYSMKGLILTVVLVAAIFLLSSLTSAIYLKRVSVYNLIHGARMVDKQVKHPVFWFVILLLGIAAMIAAFVWLSQDMEATFRGASSGVGILWSLVLLAAAVVILHVALARSVVNLLLKRPGFCSRGTNTFTLRQLSGKLNANSMMTGALALLLAFAIVGVNTSFVQKISEQEMLDRFYPFDVEYNQDYYNTYDEASASPISQEEGEGIIEKFGTIQEKIPYNVYDTGDNQLYSHTPWSGEEYEGLTDTVMTESDFNRWWTAQGNDPVQLNGGFMIASEEPRVEDIDFAGAEITLGGKTYGYQGSVPDCTRVFFTYMVGIVPDEAVKDLKLAAECVAYDMAGHYDGPALEKALSYWQSFEYEGETVESVECDYMIREAARIERNQFSAIFIVGAIYVAVVFVLMAMAILALKTLSGISEDRQRYRMLFQLGVGAAEQGKTLFRQIFTFFFLPFAIPLLMGVPTAYLSGELMGMTTGSMDAVVSVRMISVAIMAVMAIIYTLYFLATYLIARSNVVRYSG